MVIKAHVKRNTYFDSITLMKIAHTLRGMEGVEDAAAIMATSPNLQLLAEAGLTPFEEKASPEDVLLVVQASNESCAEAALQAAEKQLGQRVNIAGGSELHEPKQLRSLEQVAQLHPDARLAVISVPGPYAALEAHQALRADLHVFLFSDNVSLEDEIALKRLARERSLLLMGPDCGTAMLNGVGLGFVNVVPHGAIGIVGASGTGIQQVMSLIAQQGKGISQVIGCGGRDLSEAVGAITTLQGLQLLEEDEQTERIVLISKPPAQTVAERVLAVAASSKKTVIVMFVGLVAAALETLQSRYGERVIITHTLAEAARHAVGEDNWQPRGEGYRVVGGAVRSSGITTFQEDVRPVHTRIVGLFSGGTLCDEAMHIWAKRLGPIYSNIPLKPEWRLMEEQKLQGYCAIDFGADEYTRGRPHPMIDPSLRLKRLQEEADNPQGSVILLDIVLGYCSHPDPASVYVPAISSASQRAQQAGRALTFVISLCGTEDDPQRLSVQAVKFKEVGAEVFTSNAEAAMRCIEIVS